MSSPLPPFGSRIAAIALACALTSACGGDSGGGATTPPVPPPVIASFTATPSAIALGGSSTLSWNATGATTLTISQGVGVVAGSSKGVSPTTTTMYTLTAANSGGSVTATATVTVGTALAVRVQPGGAVSGRRLTTQPVVEVVDSSGTKVPGVAVPVAASVVGGTEGAATLGGSVVVQAADGVGAFTDLAATGAGQVSLRFTSGSLREAQSAPIRLAAPGCMTSAPPPNVAGPARVPTFRNMGATVMPPPAGPGRVVVAGALITLIANVTLPDGTPAIFVGRGSAPPFPRTAVSFQLLASRGGTLVDVTLDYMDSVPAFEAARMVENVDLNGDGRPDLFIAAHGYDAPPFAGERNGLLLSDGTGRWRDRADLLPVDIDFTHSATSADIGRDGRLDLYVGDLQPPPYFLLGSPDGGYTRSTAGLPETVVGSVGRRYYSASHFLDVNNDGYPDLILGTMDAGSADSVILFNDGAGGFSYSVPLTAGTFLHPHYLDFLPMDVNGDGCTDLVASQSQWNPFYIGHSVQVLMNRGDGTFADESWRLGSGYFSTSGYWIGFIRSIDLNGDGRPDLVAYDMIGSLAGAGDLLQGSPVFAWLDNGDGTYQPLAMSALGKTSADLPNFSGLMVAFDADGDGKVDMIELAFEETTGALRYLLFRQE